MASFALTTSLNLSLHSLRPRPRPHLRTIYSKPLSLPSPKPIRPTSTSSLSMSESNFSTALLPLISTQKSSRGLSVKALASVVPAPAAPPTEPWKGAAMKPLLASIATGVILWFVPVPAGVTKNAWQLLAIFLATIVGIITQPLPLGAMALMDLGEIIFI